MLACKVEKEEREKAQINTINDDKGKKRNTSTDKLTIRKYKQTCTPE